MNLANSLDLSDGEVVSLVGAGGKTTVMYALAKELANQGKKTVITTTTKIWPPRPEEAHLLIVEKDLEKVLSLLKEGLKKFNIIAVGTGVQNDGKLAGIPPEWVREIRKIEGINSLVVEADGAAGKPLKAPREYEPVIPEDSNVVISVAGIDALGKELSEVNVHRIDRVVALTSLKPGDIITPEAVATVMLHPQGNIKGSPAGARIIPLINKVEDDYELVQARMIARLLIKGGAGSVILAHAAHEPEVIEVIHG